jgi:hypothetical protein
MRPVSQGDRIRALANQDFADRRGPRRKPVIKYAVCNECLGEGSLNPEISGEDCRACAGTGIHGRGVTLLNRNENGAPAAQARTTPADQE